MIDYEGTEWDAPKEADLRDWATELDPAYLPDGDRAKADHGVEIREVKKHAC